MAQIISFLHQNTEISEYSQHTPTAFPFPKVSPHRSFGHSTCDLLFRSLTDQSPCQPLNRLGSEEWGQALSSMCALCPLTQAEFSGANRAFTAGFSLCSQHRGPWRQKTQNLGVPGASILNCIWPYNLSYPFFFSFVKHEKLSLWRSFGVRLKEMTSTKYSSEVFVTHQN